MEFKILKYDMYLKIELLLLSILKDCKDYFARKDILHYVDTNDECYDDTSDVKYEIEKFLTQDYDIVQTIANHIAKHVHNPASLIELQNEIDISYEKNMIDIDAFTLVFRDYVNFRDHRDYTKKWGNNTVNYTQETHYQSLIDFLTHKVYVRGY